MAKIRLDKYLADMGLGTRTEVKKFIKKGQITVNDVIIRAPEYKTDTQTDRVCADGQPVSYAGVEYYMLNKPQGVVSATEDKREKTVLDLIVSKKRKDLFPVGRLDKDTEGLLLITNNGELAHQLLSPKKHVDKTYVTKLLASSCTGRCCKAGRGCGYWRAGTYPAGKGEAVKYRRNRSADYHLGREVPSGETDVSGSWKPGGVSETDFYGKSGAG